MIGVSRSIEATLPPMTLPDREQFAELARRGNVVVLSRRLMSDQLTPVLAYRRLVQPDQRTDPSFLLESVEGGATVGRYSLLGARPQIEIVAHGHDVPGQMIARYPPPWT